MVAEVHRSGAEFRNPCVLHHSFARHEQGEGEVFIHFYMCGCTNCLIGCNQRLRTVGIPLGNQTVWTVGLSGFRRNSALPETTALVMEPYFRGGTNPNSPVQMVRKAGAACDGLL